jgi:hypothetical protein
MSQNSNQPYSQRQQHPPSRDSHGDQKVRRSPPQEARHYTNPSHEAYSNPSKLHDSRPNTRQQDKPTDAYAAPKYNSYMRDEPVPSKSAHPPRKDFKKQAEPSRVSPKNPQYLKNENVISAVLALIKDLNISELEFIKKEINVRLGRLSLISQMS